MLLLSTPCRPAASLVVDVFQLDCSQASPREVRAAFKASRKILSRCGLSLRLGSYQSLRARPEWCLLPAGQKARLKVTDQLARPRRGLQPRHLSLFLVPATQDARLSWSEVALLEAPCGSALSAQDLAAYGSLFMTDMAWDAARRHDADSPAGFKPWAAILLAHEIFHAATFTRHPTNMPPGNLMADGLGGMGANLVPAQCECLKRSPYLHD